MKLFQKPSKEEIIVFLIGIVGMNLCKWMSSYMHNIHDATEFTVEAMQEALYGSQMAGIFQILGNVILIVTILRLWVLHNRKQK